MGDMVRVISDFSVVDVWWMSVSVLRCDVLAWHQGLEVERLPVGGVRAGSLRAGEAAGCSAAGWLGYGWRSRWFGPTAAVAVKFPQRVPWWPSVVA